MQERVTPTVYQDDRATLLDNVIRREQSLRAAFYSHPTTTVERMLRGVERVRGSLVEDLQRTGEEGEEIAEQVIFYASRDGKGGDENEI